MKKYKAFFFVFGIVAVLSYSVTFSLSHQKMKSTQIIFKNVSVVIQVSDTVFLRAQGLSGRKELKDGEGMWFDFGREVPPSSLGFWMKEMNFPIDIIWVSGGLNVTFIKQNALSSSYPEVFSPSLAGRYVLEVPAGFSQKYGVSIGDTVKVQK